jgi:putative proteasome-type protease
MTYCLAIKVKEGLVAIADTCITAGSNTSTKKKVYIEQYENHSIFIMTSGLRSVRDKTINYFQELSEVNKTHNKLYKAVNAFGEQLKRVAQEDKSFLANAGLKFNLYTIIGGQLKDDESQKLFMIYPEGNWVELEEDSAYTIIGNSTQGKAILNTVIDSNTSMKQALKAGFLSFDATRLSANNVDFPIDVVLYKKNSFNMFEKRYEQKELIELSDLWAKKLKKSLDELPENWIHSTFNKHEEKLENLK